MSKYSTTVSVSKDSQQVLEAATRFFGDCGFNVSPIRDHAFMIESPSMNTGKREKLNVISKGTVACHGNTLSIDADLSRADKISRLIWIFSIATDIVAAAVLVTVLRDNVSLLGVALAAIIIPELAILPFLPMLMKSVCAKSIDKVMKKIAQNS